MENLPRILAGTWVVILGAVVGSFLNVVIARLPAGLSLVRPRSRCPSCETPIAWYDNVPILSFLVLRARCRACRRPISWRYPLVEALTAGAAWLAYARHGLDASALAELVLVSVLLALAFIDLDTWSLPLPLTVPLLAVGLLASALHQTTAGNLGSALIGASVGGGAFFLVGFVGERIFKRETMGLGDAWLLAGIGAWLGHVALLPVVLLASLQGSVIGVVQLALGKGQPGPAEARPEKTAAALSEAEREEAWTPPRHAIPFGPFLALAALEWLYLAPGLARAVPLLEPFV